MSDLDKLKTMVRALLAQELAHELPTQQRIRDVIAAVRPACPDVTEQEAEDLAIRFEEAHGVLMTEGAALEGHGFEPWLDASRSEIEFYYWNRYRDLLGEKGLSGQVLGGLSNVTEKILGLLENPKKNGTWDRRGMVLGHVQSGKTANYIGVVSRAADAGYRVIIIIAGLQNSLRNQTQHRVDEGFIGFSNVTSGSHLSARYVLGVGRFDSKRQPSAFTTSYRDFHKATAESLNIPLQNLTEPVVFVIKKNTATLRNLIEWLRKHNAELGTEKIREPMLLIDDEADNASINIQQRIDSVSRINGQIRELLDLFERSSYVGYTATPFANIFIDPDSEDDMVGHDLFPRDFIISLDAPTNYFGPSSVFQDENTSVVLNLEDYEELLPTSHKKEHVVTILPSSLLDAIRTFIVARAIRLARGQNRVHNSMLVNVSRFVAVQQQVRNEIQSRVDEIEASVRVNGSLSLRDALRDPVIRDIKTIYHNQYEKSCGIAWGTIQKYLFESVSAIRIVEINGRSGDSLDYESHEGNGLNVIAVGGMSLSRGLTLEGLSVSYFLRRSMMYDTLFQMGRWFGYRDGYDDLCRVWMPEEAQGWYSHISDSIDELRDELARMQSANATPKEFGLKVRSHPDTLQVTARNKMGTGLNQTVRIGLANRFVETAILRPDSDSRRANLVAVERLAEQLRKQGLDPANGEELGGRRLVRGAPVSVVDTFISMFRNHPAAFATESEPVRRYIEERASSELSDWDILFEGVQRETADSLINERLGFRLVCQRRSRGKRSDDSMLMVTNKQRVSTRGIAKVGLSKQEADSAESEYDSQNSRVAGGKNYPDYIYGRVRQKPLLVIHLLAIGDLGADLSKSEPYAAWSISFPSTRLEDSTVEYVVNTTWFREHFGADDDDDDDEFDDNGS